VAKKRAPIAKPIPSDSTEAQRKKAKRGQTVPSDLPKLVTHLLVAERMGVPAATIRKWATSNPPQFPRPKLVVGQMWFYNEERIKRYLEGKGWSEPGE
jgi:hypothetical protein